MNSFRTALLAGLVSLASFAVARADDASPAIDPADQRDRQKEVQADTDLTVRRIQTLVRVLDFYQANKNAQRAALDDIAQTLKGLSKEQMRDVIARLDSAARTEQAGKSTEEIEAAYGKHREILDSIKNMLGRLEAVQNLDQAAERFEKLSKVQRAEYLKLGEYFRVRAELADPNLTITQRLLLERKLGRKAIEDKKVVDFQKEIQTDVLQLLAQINLRVHCNAMLSDDRQGSASSTCPNWSSSRNCCRR